MTGIHDLWLFVVSGLLLNMTPGADTLYIVGRGTTQGWRAGAIAALGMFNVTNQHTFAAIFQRDMGTKGDVAGRRGAGPDAGGSMPVG